MVRREASIGGVKVEEIETASALLGLTYTSGQRMLRIAFDKFKGNTDFQKEILNYLHRQKEQLLARELGMTILKPTSDDVPFGMDFLMRDLEIHRYLICIEGQDREKGWLLIGTPGSGKSLLAKYLGYKLAYPAISFNISSVMNSLVGQTEKNMYNFCKVIETFAPCILYFDEFEKALSSGQELDGGTMTRALGILFTWLNDTNAPVFLLASANNLDPTHGLALTRRGRFSQLYWVGEPSHQARYDISKAAFKRRNVEVSEDILKKLADKTCYFSGADLVWLVNEVITESEHYGHGPKEARFRERIMELVEENRGRVDTMKSQYDPLREWARAYCRPAGLPPEK
ncbi:MAG: AAA family ATPase [Thermodesulfovibrionales bacterium]|nr:AAA family ATPase [Thermodesulfovibrionales bacterium]